MNILFSVDPWIYRDCAANQIYSLDKIFKKAISALVRCGHNVKLLLGEDLEDCVIETGLNIECDRCISPNFYHRLWFQNCFFTQSGPQTTRQNHNFHLIFPSYFLKQKSRFI